MRRPTVTAGPKDEAAGFDLGADWVPDLPHGACPHCHFPLSGAGVRRVQDPNPRCDAGGPSLAKQSMAEQTDINFIMARYVKTGVLESWNARPGRYGDWSGVPEYRECLNRILEAQDAFDALPVHVRTHCENDPVKFLELVHDPNRLEELRGLGLVPPGAAADQAEPAPVSGVPRGGAAGAGSEGPAPADSPLSS